MGETQTEIDKNEDISLRTTHGPILGRRCTTIYGDTYYSFERIRYAKPPLGQLRFSPPVPVEPWQGQLDCRFTGVKPIQKNSATQEIEGSEDCLYLNVYTKSLNTAKSLPALVSFFGGGFEKGDPTKDLHSPDYFMMSDVVIVTISYRVGSLGFLSLVTPELGVPGNAGLKDQVLALKWFINNARSFNADPKNVTVFGESAGAASAHYLMLNPQVKDLFQKAVLQSGNVLCPWALADISDLTKRLGEALGFKAENDNEKELLEFLRQVPAEDLVRPNLLTKAENLDDYVFQFGPVVEPYDTPENVLPKSPEQLIDHAWGNAIPVIMGGTSFEGIFMYARVHAQPDLLLSLKDQPEHMLPRELKSKYNLDKSRALGHKLRNVHFGTKALTFENVLTYCEYASYKIFWLPILRVIKSRLKHRSAPTYLYRFDFDSPDFNHQRIKYCGKNSHGVAHVDDHSYIWYGSFSWKVQQDSDEFKTIKRIIDIWTTFASTSNPNCYSTKEQLNEKVWHSLKGNEEIWNCLNIGKELKLIPLPEHEKLKVWESIYEEH